MVYALKIVMFMCALFANVATAEGEVTVTSGFNYHDSDDAGAQGVSQVDSNIDASTPAEQTQYYTIQSGDSLSKIAKEYLGNAMNYGKIFDANREVIKDPDLIYPGQKIRIPFSFDKPKADTPIVNSDSTPAILEVYFEYEDGRRIPGNYVEIGNRVNWVIRTKNLVGETITINFGNTDDYDLDYEGTIIRGDILEGIRIKSDLHKIPLTIIHPQSK